MGQQNILKDMDRYIQRLENMGEQDRIEAIEYPIGILIDYALNKLDTISQTALRKKIKHNPMLETKYGTITYLVENFSIKSESQYKDFMRKFLGIEV